MTQHSIEARSRTDHWLFAATLILLMWLPLPWGSHRPWAADLFVSASTTLLGLRLLATAGGAILTSPGLRMQLLLPSLWWLVWMGWLAVPLLPIDGDTLSALSPHAAALHIASAEALGAMPTTTLSIAPSATLDGWLLSAGYASLYCLIVLSCHADRGRVRWVLSAIVAAGLLQALYGSLMVLSGIEWGFFQEKRFYRHVATGTFVNRNHLAGYLSLAGAAALGLVLADLGGARPARSWRQRLRDVIALAFSTKMRARVALAIIAIGLVLTRSRMGNISFFASLCACGMCFVLLQRREYALRAFVLFASVVAIDILIVSNWYGLDRVIDRIEETDLASEGRAVFLDQVPPVIEAYRWLGSGVGTFAYAFAPFRTERMAEHFDHAHNDYIEFTIETGIIGTTLLATFVLAHALHAVRMLIHRRRRMAVAVGFAALMSITAQAIHAMTDFNLQIPANAATLVALLALCASYSSRSEQGRPARGDTPPSRSIRLSRQGGSPAPGRSA